MKVDALLCDAVTVRDSLLHILGGGVTRLWRDEYPAPMDIQLALLISLSPAEAMTKPQNIQVRILGVDGQEIGGLTGTFGVDKGPDSLPGEELHLPVALSLRPIGLPGPGPYTLAILINGHEMRSLSFVAAPHPTAAAP